MWLLSILELRGLGLPSLQLLPMATVTLKKDYILKFVHLVRMESC